MYIRGNLSLVEDAIITYLEYTKESTEKKYLLEPIES